MKKLLGGIMIAVGIFMMAVSGLCSGFFLLQGFGGPITLEFVGLVLTLGVPPFVIGIGFIFAGRAFVRAARNDP